MNDRISLHFDVDGENFASAGEASDAVKMRLKQIGVPADKIRRAAIAMYEAEINMVIHANGGYADVDIFSDRVELKMSDQGPGIPDIDLAMQAGYSTAPDSIRSLGFGAGMGLPNMKKYSDVFKIDSKQGSGTTVYITVYF